MAPNSVYYLLFYEGFAFPVGLIPLALYLGLVAFDLQLIS